jgi:hypothetical protein
MHRMTSNYLLGIALTTKNQPLMFRAINVLWGEKHMEMSNEN